MRARLKIQVSDERAITVQNEIALGSEPKARFYAMVAASTVIAAFGLIMNSTAVVIGAMLVAPLMTPIMGIALALVRGDASLLGRAVRAEIAGVLLAVAISACLGFLVPELEATEEMLSRTQPNLLDLLVAVLAGFAGAYAMVDEHISPALPGVAIAVAIVPPLANTGLCISLGAYHGASGSFLLFFANFLSILLVASAIFFASGMAREFGKVQKKDIVRRFGVAAVGFIIVAAFLSNSLYKMIEARRLKDAIDFELAEEFSQIPATAIRKVVHQNYKGRVYVLAHVDAPSVIVPSRVRKMEERLQKDLKIPIELIVRTSLTRDVSSTGSLNQVITASLDGFFLGQKPDPKIRTIRLAEQTIREFLSTRLGLNLEEVHLLSTDKSPTLLATVFGFRKMSGEEIHGLENEIRQRVGDDTLSLMIRHIDASLFDRWGEAHYEWLTFESSIPEQHRKLEEIGEFLEKEFKKGEHFLYNYDFSIREGFYHILVELTGPRLYTQEELVDLRKKLSKIVGSKVKVYVRYKPEVVVTEDGYTSFDRLNNQFLQEAETIYQKEIDMILEEAL